MKGILIFIKNPIPGKAKTRLAKDIGTQKAYEIYLELLHHTKSITKDLEVKKLLYYAWNIDNDDQWEANIFQKRLQNQAEDLGLKMYDAFEEAFKQQLEEVLIIGSDCYELTEEHLITAFSELESNDAILGPANDGGYYLIGLNKSRIKGELKQVMNALFLGKDWSHDKVGEEAVTQFKSHDLKFKILKSLNDIDTLGDLKGNLLEIAHLEN